MCRDLSRDIASRPTPFVQSETPTQTMRDTVASNSCHREPLEIQPAAEPDLEASEALSYLSRRPSTAIAYASAGAMRNRVSRASRATWIRIRSCAA